MRRGVTRQGRQPQTLVTVDLDAELNTVILVGDPGLVAKIEQLVVNVLDHEGARAAVPTDVRD